MVETISSSTFVLRRTAGNQDGIWATVLQGTMTTAQGKDKDYLPGHKWQNAEAFVWLAFYPEFQTPYLYFSSHYKKGVFKMEFKKVC